MALLIAVALLGQAGHLGGQGAQTSADHGTAIAGAPAAEPEGSPPEQSPAPEPLVDGEGTAEDGNAGPDQRPSGTVGPQQPSSTDREAKAVIDAAASPEETLAAYLRLADVSLSDPSGVDDQLLERLVYGRALAELRSMILEHEVTGVRQVGTRTLVGSEVHQEVAGEVTIDACLDDRDVRFVHPGGEPFPTGERDARSLHRFLLVRTSSVWKVAEHQFPEPDNC